MTMNLKNNIAEEAAIPNPALQVLSGLVGEWKTTGSHPLLPGTVLHGRASFDWIEGGAFLIWYSKVDQKGFPAGIAIFGSDDKTGELFMLYFDDRKISRKYDVSCDGKTIKWWRNAAGFSQRYTWSISDEGNQITGKGELSKDGENWEKDLEQTFTRIK
jgi:hypothetical protein